jgi:SSS family transporter
MSVIDWALFIAFLAYVVFDGTRRARQNRTPEDYFLAGRQVPWWAVGLSIMATQASAITMVGTTGQGWYDGLRFVQFYFALPLAMLIIAVTAVPLYHRLKVSTAYEYLGVRFDAKTRVLSAVLFLVLRGLSVGFVIYTPSLVLAKVFNVPLSTTIIIMGGIAVIYTSIGGLRAVISTDVKQMAVMVIGLVVAFFAILAHLPNGVGLKEALSLAGEAGRLEVVSLRWDPSEKYTLWSSLIGGLFLFLSYFGTDQSQVQRLLAARSVRHAQGALMLNAVFKVPFQFLVLTCGVLLFAFYTFQTAPITFEPSRTGVVLEAEAAREYQEVKAEFEDVQLRLRDAARATVSESGPGSDSESGAEFRTLLRESERLRDQAREIRGGVGDTNYVFLDFILNYLPVGIVGLLLASIFAAALSSIDSELNAMTTVAVLDFVQFFRKTPLKGSALIRTSRLATLAVGAFATGFALFAGEIGSLIEAVNRVGSYIYGSLLGAFILAVAVPRANGHGAFFGLIAGMIAVTYAAQTGLSFLYLNTVGAVVVVVVGTLISLLSRRNTRTELR